MPGCKNAHRTADKEKWDAKIIGAIKGAGRISRDDLAEKFGVERVKMTDRLKRMKQRGLITWVGRNREEALWVLAGSEPPRVKEAPVEEKIDRNHFVHVIVSAKNAKPLACNGPMWVFDMARTEERRT